MEKHKKYKLPVLKQKPYGNCKVFAPDGELLFRCSVKTINWYLKRQLADIIEEDNNRISIRLNFEPAGRGGKGNIFLLSDKENKCVVCGEENELSKHHVVPRCYRTWFPKQFKSRQSHDVLITCRECHTQYEQFADELRKELSIKYNAPLFNQTPKDIKEYNRALMQAYSLWKYKEKIPEDKRKNMYSFIQKALNIDSLDEELIEQIANQPKKSFTESDSVHGKLVVSSLDDIQDFIQMWRKHFVDYAKPSFLPLGWSIDFSCEYNEE